MKTKAELEQLSNEDLIAGFLQLQEERDQAKLDLEVANEDIQKLNKKLATAEKVVPAVGHPTVKCDDEEYFMTIPSAEFRGKIITAETLNANESLTRELVRRQVGYLVLKGEEEAQ